MAAEPAPIDVWDIRTFDSGLLALFERHADLITNYIQTDHQIALLYLCSPSNPPMVRPKNQYAHDFSAFQETLWPEMQQRTIRAFHYTRLTDEEVAVMRRDGVHVSTLESLRLRLNTVVAAGLLSCEMADRLHAKSPLHYTEQLPGRLGKFWMTSHPFSVDYSGVELLLKYWGGEVGSMYIKDGDEVLAVLASIGKSRIVEVAAPIWLTKQSFAAGRAVIATFARSRGASPDRSDFDLRIEQPLPQTAVLAIHTEGDESFEQMGRGYPAGFIG